MHLQQSLVQLGPISVLEPKPVLSLELMKQLALELVLRLQQVQAPPSLNYLLKEDQLELEQTKLVQYGRLMSQYLEEKHSSLVKLYSNEHSLGFLLTP